MKKLLLIFLIGFALLSCKKEDSIQPINQQITTSRVDNSFAII